jgi:hypothetical protein
VTNSQLVVQEAEVTSLAAQQSLQSGDRFLVGLSGCQSQVQVGPARRLQGAELVIEHFRETVVMVMGYVVEQV